MRSKSPPPSRLTTTVSSRTSLPTPSTRLSRFPARAQQRPPSLERRLPAPPAARAALDKMRYSENGPPRISTRFGHGNRVWAVMLQCLSGRVARTQSVGGSAISIRSSTCPPASISQHLAGHPQVPWVSLHNPRPRPRCAHHTRSPEACPCRPGRRRARCARRSWPQHSTRPLAKARSRWGARRLGTASTPASASGGTPVEIQLTAVG